MSIIQLDKNQNLMASVENELDYINKDGVKAIKNVETAITQVVREANSLVKNNAGNVFVSIQDKNEQYATYYPREVQNGGAIVLMPSGRDQAEKNKGPIYFNKVYETDEKGFLKVNEKTGEPLYFYSINKESPAAKDLIDNIKVNEFQRQDGSLGQSISMRVGLNNPELAQSITEFQKAPHDKSKTVAVISYEGVRITTMQTLSDEKKIKEAQKAQEQQAQQVQQKDNGQDR